MDYPAHIRYEDDEKTIKITQFVEEHSRTTAHYAAENARGAGLYSCAYLAGLLHDMGKCTRKFADYIERAARGEKVIKGSVNHTFCGVVYLFSRYRKKPLTLEALTCEAVAFAIGSHHGEFDIVDFNGNSGFEHRLSADRTELCYDEATSAFLEQVADEAEIDSLFSKAVDELTALCERLKTCVTTLKDMSFLTGMAARLLLAAVIDGDRRDTAEFYDGKKQEFITADKQFWKKQLAALEDNLSGLDCTSPINAARREFSEKCSDFGTMNGDGIYRLSLPTGGGKTLSALRYSLANATAFSRKRIIFVIPLLSILEQNSEVIGRNIADRDCITEHHSNVIKDFSSEEELDRYELMTETWKAPVIITTLVQLLNTLFSGKTTSIRRMNALSDCVLVIDEIQSLPKKTVKMFNMAMNFLSACCNATIVLSSATQPCFDNMKSGIKYSENADIVPYDERLFAIFKRTEVIDKTTPYGMSIDELAGFAAEISESASSLLIICNTKSSAEKLYDKLCGSGARLFHLSAAMCMAHRRDVLDEINKCLSKREKIICVSTQIVEAGVDFSFESVIRVVAGIDNIAQAAGRCNRSNDFGGVKNVYVVNLKAGNENLSMLREIVASQRCTASLLYSYRSAPQQYDSDILGNKSIDRYYSLLFNDNEIKPALDYPAKAAGGREVRLYSLLADNSDIRRRSFSDKYLLNQAFKTAGGLFEVFDENTTEIIVPYNDEADEIIANLNSERAKHDYGYVKENVERAKPYIIRIFEYQRRMLGGMIYPLAAGRILALNKTCYNDRKGLCSGDNNYIL